MRDQQRQKKVEIFTKSYCGYCKYAKETLQQHKIEFTEIKLDFDAQMEKSIKQKTSWTTVPIILINDECIGGYSELTERLQTRGIDKTFFNKPSSVS